MSFLSLLSLFFFWSLFCPKWYCYTSYLFMHDFSFSIPSFSVFYVLSSEVRFYWKYIDESCFFFSILPLCIFWFGHSVYLHLKWLLICIYCHFLIYFLVVYVVFPCSFLLPSVSSFVVWWFSLVPCFYSFISVFGVSFRFWSFSYYWISIYHLSIFHLSIMLKVV